MLPAFDDNAAFIWAIFLIGLTVSTAPVTAHISDSM